MRMRESANRSGQLDDCAGFEYEERERMLEARIADLTADNDLLR